MTGLTLKKTLPYVAAATIVAVAFFTFARLQFETLWSAPAVPVALQLANSALSKNRSQPQEITAAPKDGGKPPFPRPAPVWQWRKNYVETRYQGTTVEVDPKATGAALELQRRLASLMAEQDDVPPDRPGHFQWVERMGGMILGWRAKIAEVTDVGGTVTVRFVVNAVQTTGAAVMPSNVDEYYTFDGKQLHYVRSEADIFTAKVTTFN
jgi:hypothetical protein